MPPLRSQVVARLPFAAFRREDCPMPRTFLLAGLGFAMVFGSLAFGGEIDYREDFALAADRSVALKQLIPGTEDYYYYHALHYLATEQFEKVDGLLQPWVQRHGETGRVWEVRMRHALLAYDKQPQKTLEYLRHRLGLHYPHERELLDAEPKLPTALDQKLVSREQFVLRASPYSNDNLEQYEDSALGWLLATPLNPNQRRSLLSRLQWPDYPNLVKLIADDLNYANSGGFGSLNIHKLLLLSQLEELLKVKPELLNQQHFVQAYLVRLQPGADEDFRHDRKVLEAYLDRLSKFAARLSPAHNSLKAHVLYHQLVLGRLRGQYDKEKFLEYLKLPRPVGYLSKRLQESEDLRRFPVNLNDNYGGVTQLTPIGNDEPLVRSFLLHFLVDARDTKEFEPYVNDVYLRHLLAEVKIVNGLGEPEQWASLLPPELFKQLKERVDIDFAFTNQTQFAANEPVKLDLYVKNVGTLIIKVFELNTKSFYRAELKEVDTDINLDGLVANYEQTQSLNDPPLKRTLKKFEFPQLSRPGVYVIDFIGNGRSSRALVRKGKLKQLVRTTSAGQTFTILNDKNELVKDASIWLGGHAYQADKDGTITVPFSTAPGRTPIVITAPVPGGGKDKAGDKAEYSSLDYFQHEAENYELVAGFYVDREALLKRKTAQLLVRSGLKLNGSAISVKLLEEVKLFVTSTDLDGVSSSQEVPDFQLFEDRETLHEFQVPPRLASLSFQLTAKVKKVSEGSKKIDLSAGETFTLNEIDRTEKIEDLHLARSAKGYSLELRGKTGEPRPSRPVTFQLKHRDFRQVFNVTLKTDPAGRITLGPLHDLASVTATGPEGTAHTWPLRNDSHTFARNVHGKVGDTLTLPYLPQEANLAAGADDVDERSLREQVSLLELLGNALTRDQLQHVIVKNGLISITELPAGDYELWLKSINQRVHIRITEGQQAGRYAVGKWRQLETKGLAPLQIESASLHAQPAKEKDKPAGEKLVIQLRNSTKFARVHIFATHYQPEYDPYLHLARVREAEPYSFRQTPAESIYLTGRNIGDEYRYIIDRKYAKKYPGNMLERPSLLLNPWAVRTTETGEQVAEGGDSFRGMGAPKPSAAERPGEQAAGGRAAAGHFANLDFLSQASAVLVNLMADEKGVVEIDREALGAHQELHIVAVDPLNTTYRSLALTEPKVEFVDLRLIEGLDPKQHYTQQKQITIVPAGKTFMLHDITTSKFEAYDSLARVYTLYATLSRDPKLIEFAFILSWPKLKPEEKRTLYSKYASHELSVFLFKKDPEFFKTVIQPYLANKKDKTFIDHFLLEDDLSSYLLPWNYGQLNTVERILLSQRAKDDRQNTSRYVTDVFSLLPPNIDNFNRLFNTAVMRSALDRDDQLGLKNAMDDQVKARMLHLGVMDTNGAVQFERLAELQDAASAADLPAAAPAPAAAGVSPLGGMAGRGGALMGKQLDQLSKLKAGEKRLEEAKQLAPKKESLQRQRRDFAKDKAETEADRKNLSASDADAYFYSESEVQRRAGIRLLYRKLDKTMEWAENNYYHLTIDQQTSALVTVNAFWKDFAERDPAQPFYSKNLAEASRNFPEMLLALALLDLPFESPKHETKFEGSQMTLTPGGPLVVFHEEIKPAPAADGSAKVLVSQNFFRHGDRYRQENGEQVDKFVSEEFLVHTVYGCQIVVTNPTSSRQKLDLLLQIPRGAIPVLNSQATKTIHLQLEPYHTQTLEYHFYFPAAGKFTHFPVHVAKNENLIASAEPFSFNVVDKPTKIDTRSWDYISQHGSADDVLAFLDKENVHGINLERIAWRMKDAKFFVQVVEKLARRHAYQHTLWSYAILHNVVPAAREFLKHEDRVINEAGGRLASTLVTIDPIERRQFEHLEYKPLVNARAHALGKKRKIVNDRFHEQYHRYLKELGYQRVLTDEDLSAVTYYLLLQDRVEEALNTFSRINPANIDMKLQYDYCAAYLDFFSDEPQAARAIAMKYTNHPVDRWRNTFNTIVQQLDEAEGKGAKTTDMEDMSQQQGTLAATEPNFDFTVEAKQIKLDYQNLTSARVNYYEMDVELLFSRNPFVQQFRGQFSSIKPNLSQEIALPEDKRSVTVNLPGELQNRNVLVEIVGAGQTKTQAYYAHALAVQVIENYGQVKITHQASGKPIPKAYVKVYAQTADGQVKFYKDGYTDLRGRFDYASLNTSDLDTATKFSLLILSDEHGALVKEATPPRR
jgi:hypothetical protein